MKQAYAYVRVSGKSQMDKTGLARQRKAIASYAKKNKLRIVKTYQEQISGTTETRAELAQLLLDLKRSPKVKLVLIEKLDRLARDLLVSEKIIHDLKQLNVNLVSVVEGEDLLNGDASRKLVRQLFGAVAEYDKSMTVEKLRVAREQTRLDRGKCEGRKSVEERKPEVMDQLKSLRRKRPGKRPLSYAKIADEMNRRGFRSVSGRAFSGKLVQYLLSPDRRNATRRTRSRQKATKRRK